jgi:hypothetical protein
MISLLSHHVLLLKEVMSKAHTVKKLGRKSPPKLGILERIERKVITKRRLADIALRGFFSQTGIFRGFILCISLSSGDNNIKQFFKYV